ncbi:MAG: trypsin-like peptidase domain-containing protein [Chromatiales bacterium]|nr:trypsin-like peptidase domain-containing protein [Chromatiales bacterium]
MRWKSESRPRRPWAAGLLLWMLLPLPSAVAGNADWESTLERVASAVVAIRFDSTRAFDTEWSQSSQATGFVVDASLGLVLTNRHVVTTGPVRAGAVFINQEEVELFPVYRDPVHDFGLYRYDPSVLRHIVPEELVLAPEAARVGLDVRVIGNDGGEQLSILSGTIARLQRQAPDYGRGRYNDFNTFYLQAASGTSGGSSGSPVIDIQGRAVALNAGAALQAASSFFLPLDRVQRALDLLRAGEAVSRGTLGAIFVHQPYDELVRLGLRPQTVARARSRHPERSGMLVVSEVQPGSSGDGLLAVGDILVRVEDEFMPDFVALAGLLDDVPGRSVSVGVERGGRPLELDVEVEDLHRQVPHEYIRFGDAVVHELSLHAARGLNRPLSGIWVASPGYTLAAAGLPRGSVITSVAGQQVPDLDALELALEGLADRQQAAVRFLTSDEPGSARLRSLRMDRRWFPAERCRRNDASGLWDCRELEPGPQALHPAGGSTRFVAHRDARVRRVAASLVMVSYQVPFQVSGIGERFYYGTGLVVDAERGWVVVDRNTVPEALGDLTITFAGSLEVPGRVLHIHPTHNLALVAYDPDLVGDTPVQSAQLRDRVPAAGEPVQVVGLRANSELATQQSQVAGLAPLMLPLSRTMRFRASNLETLELVSGPDSYDGVILDRRGDIVALWSSFAIQSGSDFQQENRGIPARLASDMLRRVRKGQPVHSLEVEWNPLPLSTARNLGLPEAKARGLEAHDPDRRQVLSVLRTVAGTPAAALLEPGDLLLSLDGAPVTRFDEVEQRSRAGQVRVEVLREGVLQEIGLPTVALDGDGLSRILLWGGALLQAPYRDMAAQRGVPPEGVYVSWSAQGSPASRHGLFAGRRIVAVDGVTVDDLDAFIAAVTNRPDRSSLRLTTVAWNDLVEVLTLRLDLVYWPGAQLLKGPDGWVRSPLD